MHTQGGNAAMTRSGKIMHTLGGVHFLNIIQWPRVNYSAYTMVYHASRGCSDVLFQDMSQVIFSTLHNKKIEYTEFNYQEMCE